MKIRTFEERYCDILEIAATQTGFAGNHARDYLQAVEGASMDDQKKLFACIIAKHRAVAIRKTADPVFPSSPQEWNAARGRLRPVVNSWVAAAFTDNQPVEETAAQLWDDLTLLEGEDRVVALAILLCSSCVPYAQLPGRLTMVKPADYYNDAQDEVSGSIGLLHRLLATEPTSLQIGVAMARMFEEVQRTDERAILISQLVAELRSTQPASGGLASILGGVLPLFGSISYPSSEEEPEED